MFEGFVKVGEELFGQGLPGVWGGAVCFAICVRVDPYDFDLGGDLVIW